MQDFPKKHDPLEACGGVCVTQTTSSACTALLFCCVRDISGRLPLGSAQCTRCEVETKNMSIRLHHCLCLSQTLTFDFSDSLLCSYSCRSLSTFSSSLDHRCSLSVASRAGKDGPNLNSVSTNSKEKSCMVYLTSLEMVKI